MIRLLTALVVVVGVSRLGAQPQVEVKKAEAPKKAADLQDKSDDELLKLVPAEVRAELLRRAAERRGFLLKLLRDTEQTPELRSTVLGMLKSLWNAETQKACIDLFDAREPALRILAAEVLGQKAKKGDPAVHEAIVHVLNDEDPIVRRALYIALGKVAAPGTADVIVTALQFDDGKDKKLREGLVQALEGLGKTGIDPLLALSDSGEKKDVDRVADVFLMLRSRAGADALPTLLKNYHLTPAQKASLVRSYKNYQLDPPLRLEPLLEYLGKLPSENMTIVKVAGVEVLAAHGALDQPQAAKLLQSWNAVPDLRKAIEAARKK